MARWCAFALALSLLSSPAFAKGPFQAFQVGNWQAGAYTDDLTGKFSTCTALASYRSGILLGVSVNSQLGWSIGFAHNDWNLRENEKIPIYLRFDRGRNFRVIGIATNVGNRGRLILVQMPNNSSLINTFRHAYVMKARVKGHLFGFSLNSTATLLPALAQCAENNIQNASSNVTSLGVGNNANDYHLEAIQLATNFILQSHLQNPHVLLRPETPAEFASFGAAWVSDKAMGAVKIVPSGPNVKGLDVAAAVAGADAKACKGKFASGRVSELVDSDVVFRGFSSCEDSAGARIVQFFVVPRKQGGFVIFSVAPKTQSMPSDQITDDSHLVGFQKAALSASQSQ